MCIERSCGDCPASSIPKRCSSAPNILFTQWAAIKMHVIELALTAPPLVAARCAVAAAACDEVDGCVVLLAQNAPSRSIDEETCSNLSVHEPPSRPASKAMETRKRKLITSETLHWH